MKMKTLTAMAAAILLVMPVVPVQAQPRSAANNPLGLAPPSGRAIVPIMEGAYDNEEDGSFTVSFGYLNRNMDSSVYIPLGSNNYIEPSEFDGLQPSHFSSDRHAGVFTVTVPASMRNESIWWYLKTGDNEILKVPGRFGKMGYTLDKNPRPQGSVSPRVWLVEGGPKGSEPMGLISDTVHTVKAGQKLELTAYAEDPSVRDANDPRNQSISLRVSWWAHQGPGEVTFTRHESMPEAEVATRGRGVTRALLANEVKLSQGDETAKVYATFSRPGDYMVRTLVDNWEASDSIGQDQCCWTNLYQTITVTP